MPGEALLVSVKPGVCVAVIVAVVFGLAVGPEWADAVFVTLPAFTSAWVVVYEPVQVIEAPGVKPPAGKAGQVTEAILISLTVIAVVGVVLPVFCAT